MNPIELDNDLLSLLPPWYRQILDYQEICQTEQQQLGALADEITSVAQNFYFQTMDLNAVQQWEQIFNIVPNPMTETLSFRQTRLLNRISSRPPFTMWFLQEKLDALIGPGAWTVNMDYPNYTLYIESAAQNQSYATEVSYTINKIKPAHIVYINKPYVQTGILLSETISLAQRVYNYRMGGWGLGLLPFATENPMGVIKTADTPSIQPALLADTAGFVSGDIASARINRSIPISTISKNISGSTLTVTYAVPESSASEITSAALLDSSGTVLTESTIYVPVTGNTVLTHTIPVSEGVNNNG